MNDTYPLVPRLCLGTHCPGGSAARTRKGLADRGAAGGAGKAVRSQAEPGNERAFLLALAAAIALAGPVRAQAEKKPAPRPAPAAVVNVIGRAAPVQVWPDEQFEAWVFGQDRNAAGARKRFDALLALQVDEIDRTCQLTAAQKAKLHLIARGDIKRLLDSYDRAKQRFNAMNNDMQRIQEIMADVRPLQLAIQAGPFANHSLFSKSLRNALTGEQFARYDAVQRERKMYRHRAQIELAVAQVEQGMPLRDAQRKALIELLTTEVKPVRTAVVGQYEFYVFMDRLGRVPEEKIRPLLSDAQWKALRRQIAQYAMFVPNLRQAGLLADDDDPAPARPAPVPRPLVR